MRIIIEDILTVTMNNKNEINTYNITIEDGKIKALSKDKVKKSNKDYIINGKYLIAIPGLFNGHIHSDVTLARGLGDGLSLYDQDHNSFVFRHKWFNNELNKEARHLSRFLQYAEALKGGTTFICDVPFWHYEDDLISPFKEVGINGAVVLDYRKNFLTGEIINQDHYFKTAENLKKEGYIPIVEAPAEENYDIALLTMLKNWAIDLDTFIQMHLAETMWRNKIVKEKFNKNSVRFLKDINFLNERIIGSHGVYLDNEELIIIKNSGARIVNCPTAEMKISDGVAPIKKIIDMNIPLGIGTDGALWNDSSCMFSEMKSLILIQRVTNGANSFDASKALYAATIGGAKIFGLEHELGSIESGKRACIVLINYNKPHMIPVYNGINSNVVQVITSCARASDVDTVIVDGKIVVQNSRLNTINEDNLLNKCQQIAENKFKNLA